MINEEIEMAEDIQQPQFTPEEEREIIHEIVELSQKSADYFKSENERKKDDRRVYSACEVYTKNDRAIRGDNRAEEIVNPLSLYHNAIHNAVLSSPYEANVDTNIEEMKEPMKFVNTKLKEILVNSDANNSVFPAGFSDAINVGGGFYYLTTNDGDIQINFASDPTAVRFDHNSKAIDGRDARFATIVDSISYDAAKELWADIPEKERLKQCETYSFAGFVSSPDSINLVSFYRRHDGNVEFIQVIADHIVKYACFEGLSSIPCVPVYGQSFYDGNKRLYKGIVRDVKTLTKIVNYCYSVLLERVAVTSVPYDYVTNEALEGNSGDYSNGNTENYTYRRYNGYTLLGENWVKNDVPIHITPTIDIGDILPIIDSSLLKIAKTIGVPEEGVGFVNSQSQQTATEVLSRNSAMVSNVSHFYRHLKQSIKHVCEIVVELLCTYNGIQNTFVVNIGGGAEVTIEKERTRQQLLALQGLVPDAAKGLITAEIVRTMNLDNADAIASAIMLTLPQELQQAMGNANNPMVLQQQVIALTQQNQQLAQQVNDMHQQIQSEEISNNAQIILAREQSVAALRSKLVDIEASANEHDKDLALKYAELELDKQQAFADVMQQQKAAYNKSREIALKELQQAVDMRREAEEKRASLLASIAEAQAPKVEIIQ